MVLRGGARKGSDQACRDGELLYSEGDLCVSLPQPIVLPVIASFCFQRGVTGDSNSFYRHRWACSIIVSLPCPHSYTLAPSRLQEASETSAELQREALNLAMSLGQDESPAWAAAGADKSGAGAGEPDAVTHVSAWPSFSFTAIYPLSCSTHVRTALSSLIPMAAHLPHRLAPAHCTLIGGYIC